MPNHADPPNRAMQPGWQRLAKPDPRRGMWAYGLDPPTQLQVLELCAGREGDDAYVRLEVGQVLDHKTMADLADVLDFLRYASDMADGSL